MNKKSKSNSKEKLLTPRLSKNSRSSKQKSVIHIIEKDSKNPQNSGFFRLPLLSEIINILKKTKKERSYQDINKLDDFLAAKYNYFSNLRNSNDAYQYSRTLAVLKYTEVPQGKDIVTYDEEGDRCYIVLEGEVSILKPQYIANKLTMKNYVDYLKKCDKEDPSKMKRKRIIEKNNHILIDVTELLDLSEVDIDDKDIHNIFIESFEKVFEAKDGFTFGEAALLHKQRRNATVRAERFCKLIYIDKQDYIKVMKDSEKKRIDDEINYFVTRFYLFNKWGYISMNKLYSLMTDIKLYKNDILYRQNDESEYIYFCIDGTCEKFCYVSFDWKKKFIDYISDYSSNFFLRVNTSKTLSYLKLMKLINESKKSVPESPVIFRDCDFGKFNLSNRRIKNINELILQKEDRFSDPYDLFKVSLNKISDNDVLGLEEVTEFKRRFTTIKVTSDYAHLKRIKAIDFFKIFINNSASERDDDLVLNYIGEKKRMLVKQIELIYKYTKNKHITKYIEEYNKCYNNINIKQRQINNKMKHYINSLSKTKKQYQKNIFLRKITKLKSFNEINNVNNFYKSNDFEIQKNEKNDSLKHKSSSKINIRSRNRLKSSKISLYQRNFDDLDNKFKFDSPKSKFSSFSPSTKNQTITKLKDDSSIINNKSISTLSKKSKSNLTITHKNFMKLNKQKNFFSISYDKSLNENDISSQNKKSRSTQTKEDKLPTFNIEEYKKNLYCKYGFFINEIIKLGLGPNIPLRKHLTQLNNDINLDNDINSMKILDINKKRGFSLDKEIRKKRYEFLKITEL